MTWLFNKCLLQLSEIFWESNDSMLLSRLYYITDPINAVYIRGKAEMYAEKVFARCGAMCNAANFIDGSVVSLECPKQKLITARHV